MLCDLEDHAELQVVLQVLADAGQLVRARRCRAARSSSRRADAGELQELRRADRAGGEDHLARARAACIARSPCAELDAGDARALDADALRLRVGQHAQIGPLQRRAQERLGARSSARRGAG